MRPNKFVIEKQVSEFRSDNGLSLSEPIALKSLLLKLNILTIFRPLSENFSGMCLKDNRAIALCSLIPINPKEDNILRLLMNCIILYRRKSHTTQV